MLTIPEPIRVQIEARLREPTGSRLVIRAGVRWGRDEAEYFVGSAEPSQQELEPGAPRARFSLFPRFMRETSWRTWDGFRAQRPPGPTLEIGLVEGGGFCGALVDGGGARPITELRLPGPGMARWRPGEGTTQPINETLPSERFSRLEGALGEASILRRFQETRWCLVGLGRTGSLLAHSLARSGVQSITLIDPDLLESHNVDAMDAVTQAAVGRPKAEVIADSLREWFPGIHVTPVVARFETAEAASRAASADVIVSAPDAGRPRLLAAMLAALYCRPHLDVGTGVFGRGETFEAGADVRLTLPSERCLLCCGGIRQLEAAAQPADWRQQRAGSLRSLNQIAAHTGLFLAERLFAGTLAGTTWQRFEASPEDPLSLTTVPLPEPVACRVCANTGNAEGLDWPAMSGAALGSVRPRLRGPLADEESFP